MLTLASSSPQRRAILEQLGVRFDVVEPAADELADGDPQALVVENARRKARSVSREAVLGVDTVVTVGDGILGKPRDELQARTFLESLRGRTHDVWSGVTIVERGVERTAAAVTAVSFRSLEPPDIDWYLASGEWRGRAGGYAIQGRGAALVERIEGDYTNVVGLPVAALLRLAPELTRA